MSRIPPLTGPRLLLLAGLLGAAASLPFVPGTTLPATFAQAPAADTPNLVGHTDPVYSVEFTPDGSLAITGSFDKTIKLWKVGRCWRLQVAPLCRGPEWALQVARRRGAAAAGGTPR